MEFGAKRAQAMESKWGTSFLVIRPQLLVTLFTIIHILAYIQAVSAFKLGEGQHKVLLDQKDCPRIQEQDFTNNYSAKVNLWRRKTAAHLQLQNDF